MDHSAAPDLSFTRKAGRFDTCMVYSKRRLIDGLSISRRGILVTSSRQTYCEV